MAFYTQIIQSLQSKSKKKSVSQSELASIVISSLCERSLDTDHHLIDKLNQLFPLLYRPFDRKKFHPVR